MKIRKELFLKEILFPLYKTKRQYSKQPQIISTDNNPIYIFKTRQNKIAQNYNNNYKICQKTMMLNKIDNSLSQLYSKNNSNTVRMPTIYSKAKSETICNSYLDKKTQNFKESLLPSNMIKINKKDKNLSEIVKVYSLNKNSNECKKQKDISKYLNNKPTKSIAKKNDKITERKKYSLFSNEFLINNMKPCLTDENEIRYSNINFNDTKNNNNLYLLANKRDKNKTNIITINNNEKRTISKQKESGAYKSFNQMENIYLISNNYNSYNNIYENELISNKYDGQISLSKNHKKITLKIDQTKKNNNKKYKINPDFVKNILIQPNNNTSKFITLSNYNNSFNRVSINDKSQKQITNQISLPKIEKQKYISSKHVNNNLYKEQNILKDEYDPKKDKNKKKKTYINDNENKALNRTRSRFSLIKEESGVSSLNSSKKQSLDENENLETLVKGMTFSDNQLIQLNIFDTSDNNKEYKEYSKQFDNIFSEKFSAK